MKITQKWLKEQCASLEMREWVMALDRRYEGAELVYELIKHKKTNWANWLIVRLLKQYQKIDYAIYAGEQILSHPKKKCLSDIQQQNAVKVSKRHIRGLKTKVIIRPTFNSNNYNATMAVDNAAETAGRIACIEAKNEMTEKIIWHGLSLLGINKKEKI